MAEEKTEKEVATTSEETATPDPQSLTAGWLVGKKIAAMRGNV